MPKCGMQCSQTQGQNHPVGEPVELMPLFVKEGVNSIAGEFPVNVKFPAGCGGLNALYGRLKFVRQNSQ
jgi:hypothetical protein